MKTYEATHYQKGIDINDKNESRSIIYSLIQPDKIVLDIGCACGDLGIALNNNKNCSLYGLEYVQESVKIAKSSGNYVEVHQCDLNYLNINKFEHYKNKFDYIVLGDILEHLYDPEDILNKLKEFLKEDGSMIISVPNISHASIKISLLLNQFEYCEYGTLDKTHIRFFTLESFLNMLKSLNLHIQNVDYTVQGIKGSLSNLKYKKIPAIFLWYIINNQESFCFQYIFQVSKKDVYSSLTNRQIIKQAVNYKLLQKIKLKSYTKLIKI